MRPDIHRAVLPSGARVLVDRVPGAEVVALHLGIDVGAADEGPDEHGAAHFVEHMVFKGTATRGVGVVAAEIEGLGGDLNAWTSHDQTVLHATVTRDHWRAALAVLADMAFHSAFDPDQVALEREVILDEIRGGEDEPDRVLAELVAARAWKVHPYGRPVIGTWASVRGLSRDALYDFWRSRYVPARAVLVISGDVDPERVQSAAAALFGPARPAAVAAPRPVEPTQSRLRTCGRIGDFDEPLLQLQFEGLHAEDADAPALEVLAELLGGGAASVLYSELKLQQALVTDVWAAVAWERDGGTLAIGCAPLVEHVAAAAEALAHVVHRVAAGEFGQEAVRRARTALTAARLFERETVDGRAQLVAWHQLMFGDTSIALSSERRLATVTAEDVRRVARRLLDSRRCVAGILGPEGGPGRRELRKWLHGLPQAPRRPRPRPRPAPQVVRQVLDNGVTLVVDPVPGSPVAALRIVGLGGQLLEQARSAGRSAVWARCVMAGAGDLDASELSAEVESRGGSLGAFAGRNSQGLRAEFPVDRFPDGLNLVLQVLEHPTFEARELTRVLAELDEEERLLPDRPEELGWRAVWRRLHGPHPYGLPPDGTVASRHRLTRRALGRLHARSFSAENLVVAVSGGVDVDATLARLARQFGRLGGGGPGLGPRPDSTWPERPCRLVLETDRSQAHGLWAWPGLRLLSPERAALDLGLAVLGGQGGRLFQALREERGLAYHVSAGSLEGWDPGAVTATLGTDPERLDEGVAAMEAELSRFFAEGPTAAELARVKAQSLGALAMDRQRASGRAAELGFWDRYGVPATHVRAWQSAAVAAVDVSAVRTALQATCAGRSGVRLLVRPTG